MKGISKTTEMEYERIRKRYKEIEKMEPKEKYKILKEKGLSEGYIKMIIGAFNNKTKDERNREVIREIWSKIREMPKNVNKFKKIKWEEITKPEGDDINSLIKGLYYYFPRRINDYAYMKYVKNMKETENKEKNYYVKKGNKFVFENYKTRGRYGRQEFDVPDELKKLINKYIEKNEIKEGEALLKYRKGSDGYNRDNLRKRIVKIFGVSVDGVRHAYITWLYKKGVKVEEIEKISERMAHSIATDIGYYDKENV